MALCVVDNEFEDASHLAAIASSSCNVPKSTLLIATSLI